MLLLLNRQFIAPPHLVGGLFEVRGRPSQPLYGRDARQSCESWKFDRRTRHQGQQSPQRTAGASVQRPI